MGLTSHNGSHNKRNYNDNNDSSYDTSFNNPKFGQLCEEYLFFCKAGAINLLKPAIRAICAPT